MKGLISFIRTCWRLYIASSGRKRLTDIVWPYSIINSEADCLYGDGEAQWQSLESQSLLLKVYDAVSSRFPFLISIFIVTSRLTNYIPLLSKVPYPSAAVLSGIFNSSPS